MLLLGAHSQHRAVVVIFLRGALLLVRHRFLTLCEFHLCLFRHLISHTAFRRLFLTMRTPLPMPHRATQLL